MTEAEWLAGNDPGPMLVFISDKASDRKSRLLGCACCRRIWEVHLSTELPTEVLAGEAFADGMLAEPELARLASERGARGGYSAAWAAHCALGAVLESNAHIVAMQAMAYAAHHSSYLVREQNEDPEPASSDPRLRSRRARAEARIAELAAEAQSRERAAQAILTRDIFGNPFRPVTPDPAWLTSDVVALARGIYDERAFDRMPILADALQDAGCDNDDILNHCRGDGPHVRGCWVVDLVLGKS